MFRGSYVPSFLEKTRNIGPSEHRPFYPLVRSYVPRVLSSEPKAKGRDGLAFFVLDYWDYLLSSSVPVRSQLPVVLIHPRVHLCTVSSFLHQTTASTHYSNVPVLFVNSSKVVLKTTAARQAVCKCNTNLCVQTCSNLPSPGVVPRPNNPDSLPTVNYINHIFVEKRFTNIALFGPQ